MKRHMNNWLMGLVLTFSSLQVVAMDERDASVLFTEANTAYEAAEYDKALALYDSITVHFSSFELWYNAGNAAFRSGNLGRSILYYERAKRISPTNDDLLVNLAIANERVADRIAELPSLGVEDLWGVLTATSRLSSWSRLTLLLNLSGFGLLAGWLFSTNPALKRTLFFSGLIFILVGFAGYGLARATHARIAANTEAVILVPKVDVKNSPGANESTAFVLHEGTKVKIQQGLGEWFEIRLANGSVGWINASAIETI